MIKLNESATQCRISVYSAFPAISECMKAIHVSLATISSCTFEVTNMKRDEQVNSDPHLHRVTQRVNVSCNGLCYMPSY